MSATIPRPMASRRMSALLKRDSGRPVSCGISQARALTATTTSGGKPPRAARPGLVAETGEAPFEESLAPLADDLSRCVEACDTVADALGMKYDTVVWADRRNRYSPARDYLPYRPHPDLVRFSYRGADGREVSVEVPDWRATIESAPAAIERLEAPVNQKT